MKIVIFLLVALISSNARAFDTLAKQAILVDDSTGTVLLEKNADEKMHPSSMSKLMTLYMLFEKLKDGSVKLEDTFMVSEKAWRMQGSKMFVMVNDNVKVEDLIRGIIVQSGNDACIVVAEGVAGTEEAFAEKMNEKAKELGLVNSNFVNSTGWTDESHLTTARDLAILGKRLIDDFPEYYHYFAEPEYTYHNITQQNRNLLLDKKYGVDGLKTGHTDAAGYGIVISAKQGDRRLFLVVNGLSGMKERAEESAKILEYGYREFKNQTLLKSGSKIATAETWLANKPKVALTVPKDFTMTVKSSDLKNFKLVTKMKEPVPAPIKVGDEIGVVEIVLSDNKVETVPLVAAEDVGKMSGFMRFLLNLKSRLTG